MKNWTYSINKALEKQYVRSIHLCRTNPDYRILHPAEAKQNPTNKVLVSPTVEAKKRIDHEHEVRIRNNFPPAVERPKRFNKSV